MRSRLGLTALLIPVCLCAAEYDNTYSKTFALSGVGEKRLVLSNIQGNIHVAGDSGSDIRISVHEHWNADTEQDLARGRNDVRVEMVQTGDTVSVTLEGPYRDNGWHGTYRFRHDYEVQVPRAI